MASPVNRRELYASPNFRVEIDDEGEIFEKLVIVNRDGVEFKVSTGVKGIFITSSKRSEVKADQEVRVKDGEIVLILTKAQEATK